MELRPLDIFAFKFLVGTTPPEHLVGFRRNLAGSIGKGPFPGLVDMYGGIVTLIETRAALLASHGYATLALTYLYGDGLPSMMMAASPSYISGAAEWFSQQEYVDESRLGTVGLCFGGFLSLSLASTLPKIRAVVNINGITITPANDYIIPCGNFSTDGGFVWPDPSHVYRSDEGVVIKDVFKCDNPACVPAWRHGAKVLEISGLDDLQVDPHWHTYFYDHWPQEYKNNIELYRYPGAGHLIEPPYAPLCRVVEPGRKRMKTIDFVAEEHHDELLMAGGYKEQHAFAQEDSWHRILGFLAENLK